MFSKHLPMKILASQNKLTWVKKEKEMFPREIQTNQINRNHSRIWNCIYCYIFQIKPHFHVLSYLSSGINYLFFSPATESLSMQSPYPNLRKALVGYLEKTCFFSSVFEIKLRTIKEWYIKRYIMSKKLCEECRQQW